MEIRRNGKAPFVKNFHENYEGGKLPFYALVELLGFGTLSKFFKNMKSEDKKAIAKNIGVKYVYLESWIESIAYVRNICAHYGRLYHVNFSKTPKLYKEYASRGIHNNRLFAILLCMKHILIREDRVFWEEFVDAIGNFIKDYPMVDVAAIGFPVDWKAILE